MCEPRPNWPVGHDKVAHGRVLKRKRPGRPTNPPFRWKFSGDYNDEGPTLNLSSGQERFPLFFGVSGNSTQVNEYTRVVNHTHPAAPQQPVNPNGDYPSFVPRLLRLRGGRRRPGPQEWALRSDEGRSMPSLDDGSPTSLSSDAADNSMPDQEEYTDSVSSIQGYTDFDSDADFLNNEQKLRDAREEFELTATKEELGQRVNHATGQRFDLEEYGLLEKEKKSEAVTPSYPSTPPPRRSGRNRGLRPESAAKLAQIQGNYPAIADFLGQWFLGHNPDMKTAPPGEFTDQASKIPQSEMDQFLVDPAMGGLPRQELAKRKRNNLYKKDASYFFDQVQKMREGHRRERPW